MKLNDILTGIRTLPNLYEAEALEILSGLCARFPQNTLAGDAILDAILMIEEDLTERKAESDNDAYLASPDHARDLFAARSERGL